MFPIIPPANYFDPAKVAARMQASNDALDAFHNGDINSYVKAITAFQMAGDGIMVPVWTLSIVIMVTKAGVKKLVNLNSFYGMSMDEIQQAIS
jgi:hypothetical protein